MVWDVKTSYRKSCDLNLLRGDSHLTLDSLFDVKHLIGNHITFKIKEVIYVTILGLGFPF